MPVKNRTDFNVNIVRHVHVDMPGGVNHSEIKADFGDTEFLANKTTTSG